MQTRLRALGEQGRALSLRHRHSPAEGRRVEPKLTR